MSLKVALKVGDILYRVDPRKLSIKVFKIISPDEKRDVVTTYENFNLEKDERKRFIQLAIEKFPFEFKGLLYFLTEDEANRYIKTQIGM
ncbi:hypothetical protein JGH11_03550 [Dysgonomonas sp. Marseille-P4677]|uniref:hypothetical protein n=1 Tax=Dysgonomonas sp. Marseille-P4677 TaxID=2364790 RepID=UPI00191487B7|nr:hypothetical protein [Dysgonomonas sp. Marseille-P4677]MBK5719939.1 hypothetical protein [Dysgonomonas sp. Marseille-P4677]